MIHQWINGSQLGFPHNKSCQLPRSPTDFLCLEAPFLPCRALMYEGYPILGSLDNLHVLKRLTIQHQSGLRTVEHGAFWCDFQAMLQQGLPLHAFQVKDAQSDYQSMQRMNSKYLVQQWNSVGCHLQCMLGSLLSSCWDPRLILALCDSVWHCLAFQCFS